MSSLSDDHQMSADVASIHIRVLNDRLAELTQKIGAVHHILTGNGSPKDGLTFRVHMLEQAMIALEPLPKIVAAHQAEAKRKAKIWAGLYGVLAPAIASVGTAGIMYFLGLH